jgi:hypothetical protein
MQATGQPYQDEVELVETESNRRFSLLSDDNIEDEDDDTGAHQQDRRPELLTER